MPYEYAHTDVTREGAPRRFACALACRECAAPRAGGGACRRRVCLWLPYCWQHARAHFGVATRDSGVLPGATGLYAVRDFARGEMIAPYAGERVDEAAVRARYGAGPLALGPYLLRGVDAACERGVASASNGAFGAVDEARANVTFEATAQRYHGPPRPAGATHGGLTLSRGNLGVRLWSVAARRIRAGEELVAHYGSKEYDAAFAERARRCDALGRACDATRRVRRVSGAASPPASPTRRTRGRGSATGARGARGGTRG